MDVYWKPRLEALEDRTLLSGGYVFTTLDDPQAGTMLGNGTRALGTNNAGQIVGYFVTTQGTQVTYHGFLLSQGKYTTLDYPGSSETIITGINDKGEMVGYADFRIPFALTHGVFTRLPNGPGASSTFPFGVNSFGQIVGSYTPSSFKTNGYLYRNGLYITVNAPSAYATYVAGVNNFSQSVGYYRLQFSFGELSFLLQNNQLIPLSGPTGATSVMANGINDLGTVVGSFADQAQETHAFVESGGQYVAFDDPNAASYTQANGITNLGEIVGYYYDANFVTHGFLATAANGPGASPDQGVVSALNHPGELLHGAALPDGTVPAQSVTASFETALLIAPLSAVNQSDSAVWGPSIRTSLALPGSKAREGGTGMLTEQAILINPNVLIDLVFANL
jgi:probable HAF family extracellular repeat protein